MHLQKLNHSFVIKLVCTNSVAAFLNLLLFADLDWAHEDKYPNTETNVQERNQKCWRAQL